MLTSGVNSEIRNVIGLMSPCHSPSQNPAGSGPVSTISFGPAAHPDNTSTARTTTSTKYLRAFRIRPPPPSVDASALTTTRALGPGSDVAYMGNHIQEPPTRLHGTRGGKSHRLPVGQSDQWRRRGLRGRRALRMRDPPPAQSGIRHLARLDAADKPFG